MLLYKQVKRDKTNKTGGTNKMNRTEAIKKVWNLVEADKIKEAEEVAREYDIEMCFGDNYITVEDDVFYF